MANDKKVTGRYRQKMRQGLVPHRYDRESRSFNLGAFKNWPSGDPSLHPSLVKADRDFLERARASR